MKFLPALLLLELMDTSYGLPNMDVVMRSDTKIYALDEGDFPTYRNGKCTIRFPRDGNWATQNGFHTGGWDANQNSHCTGYDFTPMYYQLQRDGNFVAYCGFSRLDYTTHTGQGFPGDYFLAIDDDCILHLYKGTFGCDSISFEEELWTNIQLEPLKNGGRLGKGEIVRDKVKGTQLIMQSVDGNLVLYGPSASGSATDNVLWASNMEWTSPPDPKFKDHYAKVTDDGFLELVGIDYQNGDEAIYFSKYLDSNGADCFTVEYDEEKDDMVAVPCDGARRARLLRGNDI